MEVLVNLFGLYFLGFIFILPIMFIFAGIQYLIDRPKSEKLSRKTKMTIALFFVINILSFFAIIAVTLFVKELSVAGAEKTAYLILYALTLLIYIIVTKLESIILDTNKFIKTMTINLEICEFKSYLFKGIHIGLIKKYIFIAYILAVLLFQLNSIGFEIVNNPFYLLMMKIGENSIVLVLACEVIINYKRQKNLERENLSKGYELFGTFVDFSKNYMDLYTWFFDKFEPLLYKEDEEFKSKIKGYRNTLESKLNEIKNMENYSKIEISSKIKTYNIFFDTFLKCLDKYLKISTTEAKANICYFILTFKEIVDKEVAIKNEKQLIKYVCKVANDNNKEDWKIAKRKKIKLN